MAVKKNEALVIVESPAKAKTITKYLGPGYEVKASMGHVRDLPKSKMSVDVSRDFAVDYQPIAGKEDVIADLKRSAKRSERVYLATDPDREGEAISWHLKELLGLPDESTYRVTFNEITKKVVNESIAQPRQIDMDLVDAQQARRVLDRVVGYQISPFLWKKIRRGLSAGRVQSVATRLVCEREEEIQDFQSEEYWSLDADLERIRPNLGRFTAAFYGTDKRQELHSEAEVNVIMEAVKNSPFTVAGVKRQEKSRNPAPPFTTSTLQQEASRKLGMSPRRAMAVAQQLYEGVDVTGEGTVGLITYMRTDSLRLSDEATAAAREFILGRYGKDYYPGKVRVYKAKAGAQDAHEAIRPSNVNLVPEEIKKDLTQEQYRLYKLIWGRFVACQMASAAYDSVTIEAQSGDYRFRATHTALKFAGYTAVYVEGKDEDEEAAQSPLPDLKEGESLELKGLKPQQHFTQPPARYTEASLIKALEEKGIGRPSTYAPTISTIEGREYVVKEGKYLRATPLGETVNMVMQDKFPDIVDYDFTAQMEDQLDEVEQGKKKWKELLGTFYKDFSKELEAAENDVGERIKVPDEVSEERCPVCGRFLVYKSGRFGRFLACPGFPECTYTQPVVEQMPGKCPRCGGRLMKRTGKSRRTGKQYTYYGCEYNIIREGNPHAKCEFMTFDVPVEQTCPTCGHTMFKLSGRGARKPFCINEECASFMPEDQRGYYKKKEPGEKAAKKTAAKKTAAKKTTAKKTAAKKTTTKKTTAKKTTAKK